MLWRRLGLCSDGCETLMLGKSKVGGGQVVDGLREGHDRRGACSTGARGPVPVQSVLIGPLRDHVDRWGTAPDSGVFACRVAV